VRAIAILVVATSCSSSGTPCVEPDTGLPTDVFCAGIYVGHDASKPSPDLMPYTPGVTLWSDGAAKQRYLYLPPGSTIDTTNLDAWSFPVGTKAVKEFRVDGTLVETRLMWKRDDASWDTGTYVWDAMGEAMLNAEPHGIVLPSGYEIPTQKDCDKCHHGGADTLLGVEAVALSLPTATGATLTDLAARGFLSAPPATTAAALPEDATGKAGPALGFLHANCGMPCHSSRGLGEETQLVMRLRATELLPSTVSATMTESYLATVNRPPTTASVASHFPGANRITPGAHDQSVIWLMAHLRGNYQMPPLISHKIDDAGTQALADWIDAL
jgi:hypothetical protein